ncbi:hypothetical protein DL95DRAFT_409269 [Leptodontidium sp. 2 PMI_412]|nr:hypothetical protein DL95DRAFT_409269 [Leptodontidium sp. 2 PMI_412]
MDSNPSDYSREYYDHYDTIEVVYNTGTNTFSYKPRSQLSSHMRKDNVRKFPIPRFCRQVIFETTWRIDPLRNSPLDNTMVRRVRLPRKVLIGRNFWGRFKEFRDSTVWSGGGLESRLTQHGEIVEVTRIG